MTSWIQRLPLRGKLRVSSDLIAVVAAIAVSGVFSVYRLVALRADNLADALSITRIVAENSTGAVAFQDSAAAATVLASLRAKPSVSGAAIDLPGRRDFAVFGASPSNADRLPPGLSAQFRGWTLRTAADVGDDPIRRGRLHITFDLRPQLWAALRAVAIALAGALVLAIALGYSIARRLHRFILGPIETLHAATQRVGAQVDYSHRAAVTSADELGELTTAFNGMLDRLQAADLKLRSTNDSLTAEIVARKRLETALVETSRQAGMAEVATGILHNVGNVLNSVNISAQLLREGLDRSQLSNLKRTAGLIQEQGEGFARFVTEDPRGRLVPSFLVGLSAALEAEHAAASRELNQLARNVEHIKEIVAAQQSFAGRGGLTERIQPRQLFDEAEQIAKASVTRHGIEILRDYADVSPVSVDRHRVLQILVNFISNAIHAVKKNAPGNRRILLRLRPSPIGAAFSVADNGIGIAAENLTRIFTHGFTTRRDGHGFGLHSGALAARLLGGEVQVESAGPGRGATFTVELPLETPHGAREAKAAAVLLSP